MRVSALCSAARLYTNVCSAHDEGVCIVDFHGAGATLSNYALDYLSYREYDKHHVVMHRDVDCGKIVDKKGKKGNGKKTGPKLEQSTRMFIARVPQLILR